MLHPQGVRGPWNAGIILDWHTVASQVVGANEFGQPIFETRRSELGELLYQFKYRNADSNQSPSMSKVFFGGSRSLSALDSAVRTRLQNVIVQGHAVLVGDANGVDRAIQSFFAAEGYRNVVVYCMDGEWRNNVGKWPIEAVSSGGRKRDFGYFALKDARMSCEADYGFMVWDGESKGTLNNVLLLTEQGKPVLVYCSPTREFLHIKSIQDFEQLQAKVTSLPMLW